MINKAIELIQEGNFQQAEEILRAELETNPDSVQARVSLAWVQLGQSDFAAVEQTLLPVLKADPVHIQALVFMGAALLELGRIEESIKYLQRVTRRQSDNVQAQFCLARALLADGKAPFAEPCLQKALKVEPDNGELWDWLGRVQLELNRIDDARRSFELARQAGESNAGMLKDFALVETILGNIDEALALSAQAVELAPQDHAMAFRYADMLIEQEQYELASQQLERLRAAGYETDKVTALLANSYARQGRHDKAISLLAELQRKPGIPAAVRLLVSLALRLCGQPETADEHLEILLAMKPAWPDAVLTRARLLYAANDQQGIELLTTFLKRRDINSWHIQQAKTLLAFALEKAGYEPIYPPQRVPATHGNSASSSAASDPTSQNFDPGLLMDWSPAEPNASATAAQAIPADLPQTVPAAFNEPATSAMQKKATQSWPAQPPDDGSRQPVFVFAWPGSGKEQLLAALAQNSDLIYMPDDEDSQGKRRARLTDRIGATELGRLSAEQITASRRLYWRAAGGGAALPAQSVPVDLQRLSTEMLPTIARYFPAAPVIVLTRDPRDMAVFWKQASHPDLDNFTTLYQSQVQQLEMCRQSLPLNFVNVDFYELCDNPEQELEKIQRAIGVEPDAQVVNMFEDIIAELPPNPGVWKEHAQDMAAIFAKFD